MIATVSLGNASAIPTADIPLLATIAFRRTVIAAVREGARLVALFGTPIDGRQLRLYVVLGDDSNGSLHVVATEVSDRYESLTPECPPAHGFERELAEQWGVVPVGHPWLKPLRFHASYVEGRDAWGRKPGASILPGVTDFYQVEGEEAHEVAVGPVHAGIIEPGHFRFQCHGEKVLHLEIALGYQHRGVERALLGGPDPRSLRLVETLAGDTTIGHATSYCQVVEALSAANVPPRADAIRAVALELERLANHAGDLGALANDIGYLPTASYCGRLRGDFLNMTALLCGSRFGRTLLEPGGVRLDLEPPRRDGLLHRLDAAMRDLEAATRLLWDTPSVVARFEETGPLTRPLVRELGLVGPPARACGVEQDVRFQYPSGMYRFAQMPVSTWHTGDVFGRAFVRWLECERAAAFVRESLATLPDGPLTTALAPLAADSFAVALTETWRGEACHVALTDGRGRFAHYKVVDPSFHNWMGLAVAMRGQEISDFPLCNKSFNLSYCGHDL
jgi:Ni,Fe-hydrogenase III large subunit